MAKGIILVDEIPLICAECAFSQITQSGSHLFCGVKNKVIYNSKPDWCPIKPCYSNEDCNTSLIKGEKESVVLSPKELIGLLQKSRQDDIVMVEINDGKDESGVIEDVMIGGGTSKGFTFIKVSTDI